VARECGCTLGCDVLSHGNSVKKSLEIVLDHVGSVDVVAVSGTFDDASMERFKRVVQERCTQPVPRILLDFRNLDFINSTCMGLLAGFQNACEAKGGNVALCGLSPELRDIVEMIHLDQLLMIRETREEAIAGLTE